MSKPQSLPTTASFHPDVIDQFVWRKILTGNPVTLISPVAGLLAAGGGFALIQLFELWMLLAAGGGVSLGVLSFLFDLSRKESIRGGYLIEANRMVEAQADELEVWLIQEFEAFDNERGQQLVERLQRHMGQLTDVLDDKFEPGASTHAHFHGMAETLRVGILNTLKDAATKMKANAAVDVDGIKRQLKSVRGDEKTNLERRLEIYETGVVNVQALQGDADQAITGLTELIHSVAEIRSGDAHDLQDFIRNVQGLAARTSGYVDERAI